MWIEVLRGEFYFPIVFPLRLGRGIDGRVQITHLIDGFVKNFKKLYSPGKLVTAKVLR